MARASTLKAIRLTHLYSGVFLAPSILFFALTGGLQTFSLHETTRGSSYVPPAILVHLGQLHKKATLVVPQRKLASPPATAAPALVQKAPAAAQPPQPSYLPMKIFFGCVALGLAVSTLTGLVMSWTYTRNKALIASSFIAGIVVPLLLLLLQR